MKRCSAIALVAIILFSPWAWADDATQKDKTTKLTAATFSGIKLRAIGPALIPAARINQLRRYSYSVARAAHTALDDVAYAEIICQLADIDGLASVTERLVS